MYEEFYGLTDEPFRLTPDPRFLYLSKKHDSGLKHLSYGIERKNGLIVLTGDIGTGKTTLLNSLVQRLDKNAHVAFFVHSQLSSISLLKSLCREFGLDMNENDKSNYDFSIELKNFLLECSYVHEDCILILDEAQNTAAEAFEQLRLLSNFETSAGKLLQILLVGHPELHDKLNQPEYAKLKQRIGTIYQLLPLDYDETQGYITQRLAIAGASKSLFTDGAIEEIFRYSRGIPRLINVICDLALFLGGSDQMHEIGRQCILNATAQLGLHVPVGYSDRPVGQDGNSKPADTVITKQAEKPRLQDSANPSALPELPHGTWRVERMRKRGGLRGSPRSVYISIVLGMIVGLALGAGLVQRGERRTNQVAALAPSQGQLTPADPVSTQADVSLSTTLEQVEQSPTRTLSPIITEPTIRATSKPDSEDRTSPFGSASQDAFNQPTIASIAERHLSLEKRGQDSARQPRQESAFAAKPEASVTLARLRILKEVIVQEGDTLGEILVREYGQFNNSLLALIQEANPDIIDPSVIQPEQKIILPVLSNDVSPD